MRYGHLYSQLMLKNNIIDDCLKSVNQISDGKLVGGKGIANRKSKVSFIKDQKILNTFLNVCLHINKEQNYNLHINGLEPLQYSEYHQDNEYGWHIDQTEPRNDNRVRKISFSVFLNDDYEGGEFDL